MSGVGRYPQEVETAVYLCCAQALQNAARQNPHSAVRLRIAELDGALAFSAECDGAGLDNFASVDGSGLQNMTDRIAALGGTLEINTSPGTGAAITGRIGLDAADPVAAGSARPATRRSDRPLIHG